MFPTHKFVMEEMNKIIYTACKSQKNKTFQCKIGDNLNCMYPELITFAEPNQPQKGVSLNENGVVDQGQLVTVLKTAFGGGVKMPPYPSTK